MKILILIVLHCLFGIASAMKNGPVLDGEFIINPKHKDTQVKFKVIKEEKNQYILELKNHKQNKRCVFDVREINAPKQTAGLNGGVSVYPNDCVIAEVGEKEIHFRLLYISFWFDKNLKLKGNITIPDVIARESLTIINSY